MVESITELRVPYCRRHVDCGEGVQMGAGGLAVPGVWGFDERAKGFQVNVYGDAAKVLQQ
jgi:hypothetical protein